MHDELMTEMLIACMPAALSSDGATHHIGFLTEV
jgi:hypothetical protein